jgi:hypothetical protein
MQRLVTARAQVLLGHLGGARRVVEQVLSSQLSPDVRAVALLVRAEIAIRSLAAKEARHALARARRQLARSRHALLERALVALEEQLLIPIARVVERGQARPADLYAVEAACRAPALLIDACRRLATAGRVTVPFSRRPVLFMLMLSLGRAWPEAASRDDLAAEVFEARRVNDSHRARLRVEVGRLRKLMSDLSAEPIATDRGYRLSATRPVILLLPPTDDDAARVGFLLGDGASWTARGLAAHAGVSPRTAQRALQALVDRGAAIRTGAGTQTRYFKPGIAIASRMLLLGLVPQT